MKQICSIYRSPREEEMYLYVLKSDGLKKIPPELLEIFGTPQHAMTLLLTPERSLARVDIAKVMAAIDENGYFLQMPPPVDDDEMTAIKYRNTILSARK